jgi:capsular polysaccharide biosynthesis protein
MRARTRRNRRPRQAPVKRAPLRKGQATAVAAPERASVWLDVQRWGDLLRANRLARYIGYGIVIVVLATVAGYGFAALGNKVWAARSEVVYELDAERPTGFLRQDRQLTTQLVTIRSHAVLEPVAAANELTVDELSKKVDASVVGESEVLRIEVHDGSPDRAETLAAAIASTYLSTTPNGTADARAHLEGELATLDERIEQLGAQVVELEQARLADAPANDPSPPLTAEEVTLQTEMQSLLDDRTEVRSRLEEVTVDELREPQVELITEAYVLDDPVSPRPKLAAAAGALAGLLVAAVTVSVLVWRQSPKPRSS